MFSSIRSGVPIIDIFSPDYDYPVRVELSGDTIESLRLFSLDTYSTTKHLDRTELMLFNPGSKDKSETSSILDYFNPQKTIIITDDVDAVKAEILDKVAKVEKYLGERRRKGQPLQAAVRVQENGAFPEIKDFLHHEIHKGHKVQTGRPTHLSTAT